MRVPDFIFDNVPFTGEWNGKRVSELLNSIDVLRDKLIYIARHSYFDAEMMGSISTLVSTAIEALEEKKKQRRQWEHELRDYIGKPVRLDRSSCNGEIICEGIGTLTEVNDMGTCTVDFGERGEFFPCARDVMPIDYKPSESEGNE